MELPKVLIAISTEEKDRIQSIIDQHDRLNELTEFVALDSEHYHIKVGQQTIEILPDWADNNFPVIIQDQEFNEAIFNALVFFKLGNYERALQLLSPEDELFATLYIYALIQNGYDIQQEEVLPFWERLDPSNQCLFIHNLNLFDSSFEQNQWYLDCIANIQDEKVKYYLIHHQNQLFIDRLNDGLEISSRDITVKNEPFKTLLLFDQAMLEYVSMKSDDQADSLNRIESVFKDFSSLCTRHGEELRAAIVNLDLAELQLLSTKYEEALKSINAALLALKKFDLSYFMAKASVLKGRILYGWSKNGSPQYYKSSINAYQNALKVFTPSEYPHECAEVKGNLALLYTDMTSSDSEQPMWYALSASCFKEAMSLYEETEDTVSLSEVAHNYATALMNFPDAKLNDHLAKAKDLFELALSHRPSDSFPHKRVISLLNYLELQLKLHNEDASQERSRLEQMEQIVDEVRGLTKDDYLIEKVDEFSTMITNLKELI
jgi:hypothetical protein